MRRISLLHQLCLTFTLTALVSAADAPKTFKAGEFSFKSPEGWKWVETTSRMRAAQLEVGEGEGKAEVIFFYFGRGGAGGTEANVARWLGQFQEPKEQLKSKVEEFKVGGRKSTIVQAEGTYMSGRPGGPKTRQPGSMLVGAIMESDGGNVFVRMVGSKAVTEKAKPAFMAMINAAME